MKKIYMFGLIARVWVPILFCCIGGYLIYDLIANPGADNSIFLPIFFLTFALVDYLTMHREYIQIDEKNDIITFHFSYKKEFNKTRKLSSIRLLRVEHEGFSAFTFKWVNSYGEEEKTACFIFLSGVFPKIICARINRQLAKAIKDIESKKDKTN